MAHKEDAAEHARLMAEAVPDCDDCELPLTVCVCDELAAERCQTCGGEDEAGNLICEGCNCCNCSCNCTETDCDCEACTERRDNGRA